MGRRLVRPLVLKDGDEPFVTIPAVGIDAGWALAKVFETPDPDMQQEDLFKLALTPEIWEQMRADGVPLVDAWRAGMAAVAHFQTLLQDTSPNGVENAEKAAQAIWESGINPEALAAWMAAQQTPAKAPPAAATTTRRRASGSGTTARKNPPVKRAARSRGSNSKRAGR